MKTIKNFLKSGLVGTAMILSSCATDKDYSVDLSRLNPWQADLFLEAGRTWGIDAWRDDSSRNKVYFGNVPPRDIAYTDLFWEYGFPDIEKLEIEPEKVYTFEVTFKHDEKWVDCSVKGSYGRDFYNVSRHEWGHIFHWKGNRIHAIEKNDIMHSPVPERCP